MLSSRTNSNGNKIESRNIVVNVPKIGKTIFNLKYMVNSSMKVKTNGINPYKPRQCHNKSVTSYLCHINPKSVNCEGSHNILVCYKTAHKLPTLGLSTQHHTLDANKAHSTSWNQPTVPRKFSSGNNNNMKNHIPKWNNNSSHNKINNNLHKSQNCWVP